jgi:GT2 family glycosyltransferase
MISIVLPVIIKNEFQFEMTKFTVWCMKNQTEINNELIIVETKSERCKNIGDKYIHRTNYSSYTEDFNAGCDLADGDFIVHIGNDVIVQRSWIEYMLECFNRYTDCGIATIAIKEPGFFIGPDKPQNSIVESFYGALMMFRSEWRLDDAFPDQMSDYDLCMQVYERGLRSYRNNAGHAFHLKEITYDTLWKDKKFTRFQTGVERFNRKWSDAHYLIKSIIIKGIAQYGKEQDV